MNKILILVRHGKACSLDAFRKDIDRVLIERGVNDGYRMATRLSQKNIEPDIILSSPATRAVHTALILTRGLYTGSYILNVFDDLYHCSQDTILNHLYSLPDDKQCVLVVGHNPGITDLAYDLTSGATSFLPTTGLAVIEYNTDSWSGIARKNPADYYFMKPKDID